MKISYSAPAKVILSGEHTVVYGKPALVSTIDLRLKLSIWKGTVKTTDRDIQFISQKVKNYLTKEKISYINIPFDFKIESEIPVGRGLGSSAALSVASSAAFLEFYTGQVFDKEIVNNLAYEIEKKFHKNPSGVDNSAVCKGGLIMYKKNIELEKLDCKISTDLEKNLFLIDSGSPKETTGQMVTFVRTKISQEILDEVESFTIKLKGSIEKGDTLLFKECLVNNERLLEQIGVVSQKTKKLFTEMSRFGVGKITGAGGLETNSGYIFFYADKKEELLNYLNKNKITYKKFVADNNGLKKI